MPWKRLVLLVVTASAAAACGPEVDLTVEPDEAAAGDRTVREGLVTRVVDGDTFRMGDERVRLIGVDTPVLRSELAVLRGTIKGSRR